MKESFAGLFKKFLRNNTIKLGSVLSGIVVDLQKGTAFVDVGLKSESPVSIEEFRNARGKIEIKIGETVDVALDAIDNGLGTTVLSREKAKKQALWSYLERSYRDSTEVTGKITGKVKGGLTVEIHEIRAFLPGSLVDVRPIHDIRSLENKKTKFKIIKLDKEKNNVVVSRRAVIESENTLERQKLFTKLHEGQEVSGTVKNLTDYGAFVDLGGIDGLLHITDLAWKRVKHPSEILRIGQKISVKILKFDRKKVRVSLGLKQMEEDPWKNIAARYSEGTRITGKVTNLTDYGFFVEIVDGIEGLVHVSEIDWTRRNVRPSQRVKKNEIVEIMVLNIDQKRRRISLGLKQCLPNPWKNFAEKYRKGDRVKGTVKSITDFGIFIKLEEGIDGLVHLSDVSWMTNHKKQVFYQKGDTIVSVVLQIDALRERVSLGLKQLVRNPFEEYASLAKKKHRVVGTITETRNGGIGVMLPHGITECIKKIRLEHIRRTIGNSIAVQVRRVDQKNRRIFLSLYDDKAPERKRSRSFARKTASSSNAMTEAFKKATHRK